MGHGRRTGKLSNLHLGALDTATGEWVMLGKTFKGLTDAMLEWQTKELLRPRDAPRGHNGLRSSGARGGDCLQRSSSEPALSGRPRTPLARVKRYRDDKTAAEADTMATVQAHRCQPTGDRRSRVTHYTGATE